MGVLLVVRNTFGASSRETNRKAEASFGGLLKRFESQSKPGTKMVYPKPFGELRRRPQPFMVGIVPYHVLIVAHLKARFGQLS